MVTRRTLLKAGLVAPLSAAFPFKLARGLLIGDELARFVDRLPIPPVLRPKHQSRRNNLAWYEVGMREFQHALHRDLPESTLWGYDGHYPGPTIEAYRNQNVYVRWLNDLRDANGVLRAEHYLAVDPCSHGVHMSGPAPRTVVHLHGAHVAPQSDGYPEDTLLPGESSVFHYPNEQAATTLWYHDHALGITRLNVYMGLAGFYLLRDPVEDALELPRGNQEIPLIIQDRTFNADGSLWYPALWQPEVFGTHVLVNGKVSPYLRIRPGKYRLRLLNGSNTRIYSLALDSGQTFYQIGSDGGLLPQPVELKTLVLAPAERADVIVDFTQRKGEVTLINTALRTTDSAAMREVMQFRIQGAYNKRGKLPANLRPVTRLREEDAVVERELDMSRAPDDCVALGFKVLIDNRGWDDITEYPQIDTTEIWSFVNRTAGVHPIHLHLVQMQILDRQPFQIMAGQIVTTGPRTLPPPNEAGWKDTVRMNGLEITRVIAHFSGHTGRYPYHCHVLEHEDHEMMRQFEVVARV